MSKLKRWSLLKKKEMKQTEELTDSNTYGRNQFIFINRWRVIDHYDSDLTFLAITWRNEKSEKTKYISLVILGFEFGRLIEKK